MLPFTFDAGHWPQIDEAADIARIMLANQYVDLDEGEQIGHPVEYDHVAQPLFSDLRPQVIDQLVASAGSRGGPEIAKA